MNGKRKEMTINFDSAIQGQKVRFIQTGKNWDSDNYRITLKKFEILSNEEKYINGVFQTFANESDNFDPHKSHVFIATSQFGFESFHLIDPPHVVYTFSSTNPWFQVELTRGFAILTGYRIKKGIPSRLKSYKIVCSDDVDKPLNSWITMIEIDEKRIDENEQLYFKIFQKPSPPVRFIRIIQTGPNWNNESSLKFFHLDFFGSYF